MTQEIDIRILPEQAASEQGIKAFLRSAKGLEADSVRVLRRSIDARQRTIYVNLRVRIYKDEEPADEPEATRSAPKPAEEPKPIAKRKPGRFAVGFKLIAMGVKAILTGRVSDRKDQ